MSFSPGEAKTLHALPFLSVLTDAELASLLPSTKRRTFLKRAHILRNDEPSDGLYLLMSGRVRLVHHDQDGRALIAETFGPGELFGELGLIEGSACPVNVIAADACEAMFIPRKAALDCLEGSAAATMSLLRTSLDRLCRAHRQMANLALTKVYTRVAQVLVSQGHEDSGEWHVDVGSEQIAAMVGASREMVSRVIRCMIEKQVVRRAKRRLIVIDRAALDAPAG